MVRLRTPPKVLAEKEKGTDREQEHKKDRVGVNPGLLLTLSPTYTGMEENLFVPLGHFKIFYS